MANRLIVVTVKVYPTGQPNGLGNQVGATNEYSKFNKPTNHLKRYATYVADASVSTATDLIETELETVSQGNI